MSVYSSANSSLQDTVKWLVGFVPVGAIVAAGGVVGPQLLDAARDADSPGDFLAAQGWAIAGVVLVIIGIGVVLWSGAGVLGAQPRALADILAQSNSDTELDEAFGAGVAAPYYFDVDTFRAEMRTLVSPGSSVTDEVRSRSLATVDVLREWDLNRQLANVYGRFKTFFGVGLALAVAGFVVSALFVDDGATNVPIPVAADLTAEATADLSASTGCSGADNQFWLVNDDWNQPVLAVVGEGCSFGAQWEPDAGAVRLFPTDADS